MVAFIDLGGLAAQDADSVIVRLAEPAALGSHLHRAVLVLDDEALATVVQDRRGLPSGWLAASVADAADAARRACDLAADADTPLLVLGSGACPSASAIGALLNALMLDPMLGVAVPRITTPDGRLLAVAPWSGGHDSVPMDVLDGQPDHRIGEESLGPCLLIGRTVMGNFRPTSGPWENHWGLVADLLVRARRAGFRTSIANRVRVAGRVGVSLAPADYRRLRSRFPELCDDRSRAPRDVCPPDLERTRAALTDRPSSLLLDARNLAPVFNGTSSALLSLAGALHVARPDADVGLWVDGEAADFHHVRERFPHWTLHRVGSRVPPHAAAIRLSQPWSEDDLDSLAAVAARVAVWMLDTIAWDIVYAAPPRLDRVWSRVGREVDALVFISEFSRQCFLRRFGVGGGVRTEVCHLSLAPADYQRPLADEGPRPPYWMVVGNQYDHKHVAPTVDAITRAFPDRRLVVFGDRAQARASTVTRFESGRVAEPLVDACLGRADVVVFPSFYEGFGLPIVQGLAYGRTVVARGSELVSELAARYRGPGRLLTFSTERELLTLLGAIGRGAPVSPVPLGTAPLVEEWTWARAAERMLTLAAEMRQSPRVGWTGDVTPEPGTMRAR